MSRAIRPKIDKLFVEGPDDGALVNALVKKTLDIELGRGVYLVQTDEQGGGTPWALSQFDRYVEEAPAGARIGVIVDRDGIDGREDNWPKVCERLRRLGVENPAPIPSGYLIEGRLGIWMWPDNASLGDLEGFLTKLLPASSLLSYADDACQIAKSTHGAEYELAHTQKAVLKVRSIWRDASAAGGYGHLVRNLPLTETSASRAFLDWFTRLYLTD